MARSECFCTNFSCESSLKPNERFRFVKEEGAITDRINLDGIEYRSGLTPNDIAHCELKSRIPYKDKTGKHFPDIEPDPVEVKPRLNYCDKGGHMERSIANDHRKKGHKEHFKKSNRR